LWELVLVAVITRSVPQICDFPRHRFVGVISMDKAARFRAHQNNIDRYQTLLKTRLSETEVRFLERRLSEERFSLALLQFMDRPDSTHIGLPDALQ
jgi:hypothetical protein